MTRAILTAAVAVAALCASAPEASAYETARLNLSLHVPVSCEAAIEEIRADGGKLLVSVDRRCNTPHRLVLAAGDAPLQVLDTTTGQTSDGARPAFRHGLQLTPTRDEFRVVGAAPQHLSVWIEAL